MTVIQHHLRHGVNGNRPHLIVVHCMAEYLDTNDDGPDPHAVDFLDKIGLSAHILVAPNGDIYRCRNDDEIAWHAKGYNKNSLGIEFLVKGCHTYGSFAETIKHPYISPEQYEAGKGIILNWIEKYGIARTNMVRHSDLSPGRKIDPGDGFQWARLVSECYPE